MTVYYSLEHVLTLWYYALLVCLGFHGWNDLTIYMYINLKYNGGMHFTNMFHCGRHFLLQRTISWHPLQPDGSGSRQTFIVRTQTGHTEDKQTDCAGDTAAGIGLSLAHTAWHDALTPLLQLFYWKFYAFFLSFHHQVNVGVIYFLHLIQFLKILRFFGVKEEGPFN